MISLYSVSFINLIVKNKGEGLKREGGTIVFFPLKGGWGVGGGLIRQGGSLMEDLMYLEIFINFT